MNATPSPPARPDSSSGLAYQYNAQGQLQTIIYPDGSTYTYQYNLHGDKIRETNRTGRTWTYFYDENQHPIRITDPEGRETHPQPGPNAP